MRHYFYAAFFALVGIIFFYVFMTESGPASVNELTKLNMPVLETHEEEFRGQTSTKFTLTTTAKQKIRLDDWFPQYESLVSAIKSGQHILEVWTGCSGVVYQIKLSDGQWVGFTDAIEAQSANNKLVAFVWLVICGVAVFWAIRKARSQE